MTNVIMTYASSCMSRITNGATTDWDSSYPDACIPAYPPDLNCGDISDKRFQVLPSDPHSFDRDGDGIGCES
jgi:micrococcal nuclease